MIATFVHLLQLSALIHVLCISHPIHLSLEGLAWVILTSINPRLKKQNTASAVEGYNGIRGVPGIGATNLLQVLPQATFLSPRKNQWENIVQRPRIEAARSRGKSSYISREIETGKPRLPPHLNRHWQQVNDNKRVPLQSYNKC